jgi:hypothetical protein
VATFGRTWLPLVTSGTLGAAAVARGPGEAFGYVFAPAQERKPGPPRLAVVAETKGHHTMGLARELMAGWIPSFACSITCLIGSLPRPSRRQSMPGMMPTQALRPLRLAA